MEVAMRARISLITLVVALAACSDSPTTSSSRPAAPVPDEAPVMFARSASSEPIPGKYIVVFTDAVTDPVGKAHEKALRHKGKLTHAFDRVIKGFAAELSDSAVAALRADPDVALVEPDQVMHASTTQSPAPSWGIDRIDQRSLPLSGTYTYNATATQQSVVRAYIIDTGIQTSHPDFGGRASAVYDAFGGNGQDCNGHGTHVAGTVGGATYGVAKSVKLRAVRVLDCSGSGSTSGIISALNWLASNAIKPAVANMSLGGGFSSSLNTAVNNLASAGIFVAVAAGNSNADACSFSPSSAANTTTVAASTSTDAKASYSNFGACVDVYAPGSSIKSDWLSSGTNTISGTSMATPHVTGVAALYKAVNGDASYSTIRSWLVNNATSGAISGNPTGTANKLLYKSTF
jgi:subtilisin family serine protease